jgi:hypothetical protein
MTALSNTLLIAIHEAKAAIDPTQPIEVQARAAMNAVKDFWLTTDDDLRFRGAIGGLLLANEKNERITKQITTEIKILRDLNAMMTGVSVDTLHMMPPKDFEPIGLGKLWLEITQSKRDGK